MKFHRVRNPYAAFQTCPLVDSAIRYADRRAARFRDIFLVVRFPRGLEVLSEFELGFRKADGVEIVYSTKDGYYMSA
jgi:hypothetical protein